MSYFAKIFSFFYKVGTTHKSTITQDCHEPAKNWNLILDSCWNRVSENPGKHREPVQGTNSRNRVSDSRDRVSDYKNQFLKTRNQFSVEDIRFQNSVARIFQSCEKKTMPIVCGLLIIISRTSNKGFHGIQHFPSFSRVRAQKKQLLFSFLQFLKPLLSSNIGFLGPGIRFLELCSRTIS